MSINLSMDFSVNKENKTITVKRECNADLPLVWDAFTKSEILDQWWAPHPYINETKSMDFSEGGKWHYSMISPEGQRHYCMLFYLKINTLKNFEAKDSFCDEEGNVITDIPSMHWNTTFLSHGESTSVNILIQFNSEKDLQTIIEMGFKEGFTMGLNQLDDLLEKIKNKMNNKTVKITVSAKISSPVENVWECWTLPEHITKWNFAHPSWECPTAENDVQVGGKYRARMQAKDGSFGFNFEAIYDVVIKHKELSYTMADGRQATTVFESNGDSTQITTTFDAETENPVELQKGGWQAILDNFKKYVENT